MKLRNLVLSASALGAALSGALLAPAALAQQAKEQFLPALVYRTGPYAPNVSTQSRNVPLLPQVQMSLGARSGVKGRRSLAQRTLDAAQGTIC